jgi:predicted Rossmann fold flavoprotein
MSHSPTISIIWWWAAGMMVAATLLEAWRPGQQIHLFEKNPWLGAKVIISWWGRCNITTGHYKRQDLSDKYPRGSDFLQPALKCFGPRSIIKRFEQHALPTKQETDLRIFPVSDDGKDVVGVFAALFTQHHLQLHLKTSITTVTRQDDQFQLHTWAQTYPSDILIITTGGNAYAHTGSSGDGYSFATALGHSITPLGPSLNSFMTTQSDRHACSGISFPTARLCSSVDPQIQTLWPVLLTHFGISWPAVFAFSAHIPYSTIDKDHPYHVLLQPIAEYDTARRDRFLIDQSNSSPKKQIKTIISGLFPQKVSELICKQVTIHTEKPIGSLTKTERQTLAQLLGAGIPLDLIQRRPGDEFVTAGGITLSEVDTLTGQSKICPWLYFAGEVLDIDGYTWGYNLTASRAMGRLVGKSIW